MTREDVDHWLEAYVQAWKSYDREAVAALFTDDVSYRYHPYDEPINGRDAMVAMGRYIGTAGQPMIEYMTWIYTTDSRAFFFARVPVDDVPLLRPSFEMLVNSAVVP